MRPKVHANASQHANRDYEQLAREILEEAAETDRPEDEQFGEARGDQLPPELATAQGRRGWLREAKRRLDEQRAEQARPIPASRRARLREAASAAFRKSSTLSAAPTPPMRPTGLA